MRVKILFLGLVASSLACREAPPAKDVEVMEFASPAPTPDGRPAAARAFDFHLGSWRVHNRALRQRLQGSDEWLEWESFFDALPILGGLGSVGRLRGVRDGRPYEGIVVRIFDPATEGWTIHWVDQDGLSITPQVTGPLGPDGGTIYGEESFEGRMVPLRFVWSHATENQARWEQAYQMADGAWEVNWIMEFTRRAVD